jgi:hypothetical protein
MKGLCTMKFTNKPQPDTQNDNLQNQATQENATEADMQEQAWWDSLCYPDAHVSDR